MGQDDIWGRSSRRQGDTKSGRPWGIAEGSKESLSPRKQRFYNTMEVWVSLLYGLAGPYCLAHGGAHANSMGVGYFTKVSEKQTEFLRYVVRHTLRPEDQRPGGMHAGFYVPRQPAWSTGCYRRWALATITATLR